MKNKKLINRSGLLESFMNHCLKTKKRKKHYSIFEKCVLCGKETDVPVSLSILKRDFYICGCGQLCENCYISLDNQEEMLSKEALEKLIRKSRKRRKAKKHSTYISEVLHK